MSEVKDQNRSVEAQGEMIDSAVQSRVKVTIPGICGRCQFAHIWRTARMNEPVVRCGETSARVPVDIMECNKFKQVGVLTVWELTQLCLDIDISKSDKKVGFQG